MGVWRSCFLPDCLHRLLPGPFLLSYSVFVSSLTYFFVSVPCARLSWPYRQLLSARKYIVSYRTHAGIAAGVSRAFICISTPNLVHIYSIAVTQHALIRRSKGQRTRSHSYENRHSRTIASDACCYTAVAGVGLHVDTTAYVY